MTSRYSRHLALVFRDIHQLLRYFILLPAAVILLPEQYIRQKISKLFRKSTYYFSKFSNTIVPYERLISTSSRDQLTFAIYSVIR